MLTANKNGTKTRKNKQIIFNIFTYTLKYNTYRQGKGSWGRVRMGLCADSTAKGETQIWEWGHVAKVFPRLLPLMACNCYTSSSQLEVTCRQSSLLQLTADTSKFDLLRMVGHHISSTALAEGQGRSHRIHPFCSSSTLAWRHSSSVSSLGL